ncbi:hypothetical protein GEOBRER4_n2760 [Citrifermentans bremense]|uniref:Uncharacterized protein n=1 Tax=Citrifermentans bremense TaxID=60035 RepID=A0A7R7FTM6_9BACT|nr:hypothetical protein GEOBRER4_n2760 [Citrifermentans bremense]
MCLGKKGAAVLIQLGTGWVVELDIIFQSLKKGRRGASNQFRQTIAGQRMTTVIA